MNQEKYGAFKFQISGHSIFLKLESSGQLIKSCSNKNNNEQEFYEYIQQCPDYTDYFPQYYGEIELNNEELQIYTDELNEWQSKLYSTRFTKQQRSIYLSNIISLEYLLLQDFSHQMDNLNILDIKLGYKAHKTSNIQKYTESTSSTIGFRINGIYKQDGYFRDKYYCRSIQQNDVIQELQTFFNINTNSKSKSKEIISQLIHQIENMKQYLLKYCQPVLSWDSVSLLILFNKNTANIHLIDFQNTKIDKLNKDLSHLNSILNAINSFQSFLQYL